MKRLYFYVITTSLFLSSCCTTDMVYNPETNQTEEELDCLNPLEVAALAIAIPVIAITDPFN